ncbi:uncharacterized protein EI90DRAFT_3086100 [Cantharellus anzutake]|uniref:uncharacterized protein n=1 Tax=Cantharellus anzutake TaxID=1750568 RepID=UPI001906CC39|nr:uncharacterized protein EI90DRAFT_3086100 [Cantharellus anzutake]KAF8316700.1 hypothetical protein EI90DRAFT_3086100 [Cantharellus anzutake]
MFFFVFFFLRPIPHPPMSAYIHTYIHFCCHLPSFLFLLSDMQIYVYVTTSHSTTFTILSILTIGSCIYIATSVISFRSNNNSMFVYTHITHTLVRTT